MKARFHVLLAMALLSLGPAFGAVVLEEVPPGSALEKAGLRPGDLVLAWEREGVRGEIRTPFDWMWMKNEQAPRGGVRLRGERDGAAISFAVPKGVWDGRVRPRTPSKLWELFESKARADLEAALAEAPDAQTRIAVLEALGESYQYANEMVRAESSFRAAVEAGEAAWGECLQVASSMTRQGNILRLQFQLDAAA